MEPRFGIGWGYSRVWVLNPSGLNPNLWVYSLINPGLILHWNFVSDATPRSLLDCTDYKLSKERDSHEDKNEDFPG
jgi:hypothetical protein